MKKTFLVKGLDCPHCSAEIENDLNKHKEIKSAVVNLVTQTLTVEYSDSIENELNDIVEKTVHSHEPEVEVSDKLSKSTVFASTPHNCSDNCGCGDKIHTKNHGSHSKVNSSHKHGSYRQKEKSRKSFISFLEDEKVIVIRLIIGAVLFAGGFALSLLDCALFVYLPLIAASYIIMGTDVCIKALLNILKGRIFDEYFLMTVSTIGAFIIGEYPEAAAVMLFYQLGEYIQGRAVKKSRRSISELMDIRPDKANVIRYGNTIEVSPEEVAVGEFILIKPGERVPLDGIVTEGSSMLDTSALTGESVPRKAVVGDTVISGCINENGTLKVKTTKKYADSTVSNILDLVENAAAKKAPAENFITTFSRYYTPIVVISAVLLALLPPLFFGGEFTDWIHRGFVFLVISCPCALVISIPLTFFGGIGTASRHGILIKGSNYLESLNAVSCIVADKTGTLTKGVFEVSKIVPEKGISENELLYTAALAESFSNHPIARSILKANTAELDKSRVKKCKETAGCGISAEIDGEKVLVGNIRLLTDNGIKAEKADEYGTIIYIAGRGKLLGHIVISDEIKSDSAKAIEGLKKQGIEKIVMLTGDSESAAKYVSDTLKLDEYISGLLPDAKTAETEKIKQSLEKGKKLAFVGDGINDAPVLALADVGIAMGGLGSDAAIEAADIVLMTDEPTKLCEAISIARYTKKIVKQNIICVIAVKILFLILGALGIASMWGAVFGDVGVMILAVLNSIRIGQCPLTIMHLKIK